MGDSTHLLCAMFKDPFSQLQHQLELRNGYDKSCDNCLSGGGGTDRGFVVAFNEMRGVADDSLDSDRCISATTLLGKFFMTICWRF